MSQQRSCADCRYGNNSMTDSPCDECFGDMKHARWEPEEPEKKARPKMIGKALPIYERKNSRIPERLRVSFEDGKTAVYDLHVDMPEPFVESIRIIRKWNNKGYRNQPTGRRGKRK